MRFKALQDLFLYNKMNATSGITKNIEAVLNKGSVVSTGQVEEQLGYIYRSYKDPLKFKIFDALEAGDVVMMYGPERAKVPTSIPFVLIEGNAGRVQAVVFIDTYGVMDKETGMVKIDTSKLYTLLTSALVAVMMYKKQESVVIKSALLSQGSAIFSSMFTRVLNKKYSLNSDILKYQKIVVLASKYYFLNILGREDNEVIMNYCIKNVSGGNALMLQEIYEKFPAEECKDIDTFVKALGSDKYSLNLKGLDTRNYLEGFINMYDASTILALESIYYFAYLIIAVNNSAYVNNQYTLQTVIDKAGIKFYSDLVSLVK